MFKLTHQNKNGTFKVILHRDVSNGEMNELCRLASNIVPQENSSDGGVHFGPHLPGPIQQQNLFEHTKSLDEQPAFIQQKLGGKPIDRINMGGYVEPSDGVRLKMIHLIPRAVITNVVKALRKPTDISIMGCKEIVYANFPCPILKLEVAQAILEEWRSLDVYAKIVPAHADAA
jgi:hypothetical protein